MYFSWLHLTLTMPFFSKVSISILFNFEVLIAKNLTSEVGLSCPLVHAYIQVQEAWKVAQGSISLRCNNIYGDWTAFTTHTVDNFSSKSISSCFHVQFRFEQIDFVVTGWNFLLVSVWNYKNIKTRNRNDQFTNPILFLSNHLGYPLSTSPISHLLKSIIPIMIHTKTCYWNNENKQKTET